MLEKAIHIVAGERGLDPDYIKEMLLGKTGTDNIEVRRINMADLIGEASSEANDRGPAGSIGDILASVFGSSPFEAAGEVPAQEEAPRSLSEALLDRVIDASDGDDSATLTVTAHGQGAHTLIQFLKFASEERIEVFVDANPELIVTVDTNSTSSEVYTGGNPTIQ